MPEVEMRTEKAKLHKTLRRWDLTLFAACAIIGLDSVAYTTSVGLGQAITWLIITFFIFLIPLGFLMSEVTAAFPAEGGIYTWCRMTLGKLLSEVTTFMYWISNPVWVGGTLTAVTIGVIDVFFTPKHPLNTWESIVVGLIYTWVVIFLSVINLKYGKWTGNLGTAFKAIIMVVMAVLGILFLARHGIPKGIAPASSYTPSISGFLAIIGVICFLWFGFELAGSAGEEMVNPQKDIPRSIFTGGAITAAMYVVVMACMLLVLKEKDLTAASGIPAAVQAVMSDAVGSGTAKAIGYFLGVVFILQYVSSGSIWVLGACRVQAVAALDGSAPRVLGRFSKQGTPVVMGILTGIVSSVMCVIVFLVTSGSLKEFIGVMIALDTSLTVVVYVFVIPAVVRLRTTHPHVHRPFVVPGGAVGLWACAAITWILSVITCITLLWPGLLNNMLGESYSISDNWGMSRLRFELMDLGTFVVLLLIAVGFWAYGRTQGTVAENAVLEGVVEEDVTMPTDSLSV
jgi:amino acid transporter